MLYARKAVDRNAGRCGAVAREAAMSGRCMSVHVRWGHWRDRPKDRPAIKPRWLCRQRPGEVLCRSELHGEEEWIVAAGSGANCGELGTAEVNRLSKSRCAGRAPLHLWTKGKGLGSEVRRARNNLGKEIESRALC